MRKIDLSTRGAEVILPPRRNMDANMILKYVLWVLPQLLIAFLVVRMVRNRLATEAPVFFAYLVFSLVKFLVRFSVYHFIGGNSTAYFHLYWDISIVDAIFVLAVIRELYIRVLSPYEGLKLFAAALFRWSAAILILVAALTAGAETSLDRYVATVATLDRCATVVQTGLVLLLFLASSSLSLPWQRHLFGIAAGLAIVITIEVVSLALSLHYGMMFAATYAWVKGVAYLGGVLAWTVYLLRRESNSVSAIASDKLRLQEWNAALLKLLGRQA